ncbi:MAG: histidine phosphatase family protein [Burkholderiaceae bacterium]
MALIILARHAQASFGSSNYDRLSDLGRRQSRWLGEYLAARGVRPQRVLAGTLQRQRDTASIVLDAMGCSDLPIGTHAGLDEYQAEPLVKAFLGVDDFAALQRADYRKYWQAFREAMQAWAEDRLADVPETWTQFGARMRDALAHASADTTRDDVVLVISSGGAICRAVAELLQAPSSTAIELNLQFRNTAFCELIAGRSGMRVLSFNNLPHMEHPERRESITAA